MSMISCGFCKKCYGQVSVAPLKDQLQIGESSNGRTPDSDSGYLGSNPGSPAKSVFENPSHRKRAGDFRLWGSMALPHYVGHGRFAVEFVRLNNPSQPQSAITLSR
jgi:hypothetical protein